MTELAIVAKCIPSMSDIAIDRVYKLESLSLNMPQVDISTSHVIHGGMYARTIMIPAGVMLTGALVKIATILIVQGDIIAYIGDQTVELHGYNVLPAAANRKQAFITQTGTYLTMIFPSDSTSVQEAESEFTDEASGLMSRKDSADNHLTITGA